MHIGAQRSAHANAKKMELVDTPSFVAFLGQLTGTLPLAFAPPGVKGLHSTWNMRLRPVSMIS